MLPWLSRQTVSASSSALETYCSTMSSVVPDLGDRGEELEQPVHHQGGETHGRLVDEHQLGIGEVGPHHGEHLLLTPAQASRGLLEPLAENGEGRRGTLDRLVDLALGGEQVEVLAEAERREDAPSFGYVADARPSDLVGFPVGDVLTLEHHLAARRPQEARHRAEERRLARPVGAEQRHHGSGVAVQRHVAQHRDLAVACCQPLHVQHAPLRCADPAWLKLPEVPRRRHCRPIMSLAPTRDPGRPERT